MKKLNWLITQGIFLSIVAALASVLSFAKEAIFANYFGVSEIADAYTVAIQIPEILFAVIWEAIHAIVVPLYTEKISKEGKRNANKFISTFFTIISLICILFVIFGEIFTNTIVSLFSPGLSSEAHVLATELMRWVLPTLIFEGVIRVCTGVLNVYQQFIVPKLLTVIRNVGIIVFLIFFANKFGVYAAIFGVLCGIVIECGLCYFTMLKKEKFKIRLDLKDPMLKKAGYMLFPLVVGIGINEINQIADKFIASLLDAGSISSLNYASKLSSIIQVVMFSNIVTVFYPVFSNIAAEGNKKQLSQTFVKVLRLVILLCVPIIFGGVFLKNEIVSLAFERGSFHHQAVYLVATLFSIYLITTLFTSINNVSVKLFASCCDTKTAAINSSIGVVINIFLNIVLSKYMGVIGLTLATLISSIFVSINSLILVRKKIYKFKISLLFSLFCKSIISAFVMLFVLIIIKSILFSGIVFSTITKIGYCLLCIIIGAIIYAVTLIIFRVDELQFFYSKLKKILHLKNN
ncbi:MAG: murein biosynthesis integral membrane protein MurJ [Bacilli bacterium]|nr:murein biosynthesis integral membrane protein MurJ [Bacilli bacterium]